MSPSQAHETVVAIPADSNGTVVSRRVDLGSTLGGSTDESQGCSFGVRL